MSEQNSGSHALILGATGLIGSSLLSQLLQDPDHKKVTVLLRRPMTIEHPKLTQIVIDFERLEQLNQQLKCDTLYCCLGTTLKAAGSKSGFRRVDFDYPLRLAKIAQQQGCQQLLLISSLGANPKANNFYLQIKGELEQALVELKFNRLQILRPSLLLGQRTQRRLLEDIGQTLAPIFNKLLLGRLRKYRAIKAETVAKAMVTLAKQNNSGVNYIESSEIAKGT